MSKDDSDKFIEEIAKENLDQEAVTILVQKAIQINKEHIWTEALEEYSLIE